MVAGCGGLSLSPVGNYTPQVIWWVCGAFLWLCRVPASTLMLMGGGASYMPFITIPNFENIGFSCCTICSIRVLSFSQKVSLGVV